MAAICNANSRAQTPFGGKGRAYGVSDGEKPKTETDIAIF